MGAGRPGRRGPPQQARSKHPVMTRGSGTREQAWLVMLSSALGDLPTPRLLALLAVLAGRRQAGGGQRVSLCSALTAVSFSSKQQTACPSRAPPHGPDSVWTWLEVARSAELRPGRWGEPRGVGAHGVLPVLTPLRSQPLVCGLISDLARVQLHGSPQETRCFRRRDWMYSRSGASSVLYLKVPPRIQGAGTGSQTLSSSGN